MWPCVESCDSQLPRTAHEKLGFILLCTLSAYSETMKCPRLEPWPVSPTYCIGNAKKKQMLRDADAHL